MEQREVIDETFAGLVTPRETFEMGRPDMVEGRPGAALVDVVRKFADDGGFQRIADDREKARMEDETADAAVARKPIRHADLGIVTKGADGHDADEALKD